MNPDAANMRAVADQAAAQTLAGVDAAVSMADLLAELRAIRGLLEQQGICPHGNSGICMYCLLPTFDAMEMAVRGAVKR